MIKLQAIRNWIYAIPVSKKLQEIFLRVLRIAVSGAVSAVLTYLAVQIKLLPIEWQTSATLILTIVVKEWDGYKWNVGADSGVKGVNNYGLLGF